MMNDGGPAFPVIGTRYDAEIHETVKVAFNGMSLRDWFAGQALAGMLAKHSDTTPSTAGSVAYIFADAMLKTREVDHA